MYILVVEDDHLQSEWICKKLGEAFPSSNIREIRTELAFRSCLEDIANNPPDVVVMDIMLPWAFPTEGMQPPPLDVREEGVHKAGIRCKTLLTNEERTKNTPVILYTVLERSDLERELQDNPPHVIYLSKGSDPEPLFRLIREFTKAKQR